MDRSRQSRGHHHALLGHAPRDPFAGCGDAPRKPAVDFSDVFGGPPKPVSGLGDAAGAGALGGGGGGGGVEDDGERSRRWSSSVVEKGVFAGVGSPAHRRHLGDGFFSDIFRGDESACPTPRRKDRDSFTPSTPGSRVLSPARPLPPTRDSFGGGAHLPAHLSYSTRLAKSFDHSSFRYFTPSAVYKHEESIPDDVISFPSSPNVCAPASPNRFFRIKDILRFDSHTSCRQSPLSHVVPHGIRPLETITSVGDRADETEKQLKKDPLGSKAYSSSGHFHFSIYKWASRGVTRILPSTFKERTKSGSRLSGLSSQVLQQADQPPDSENMLQGTQAFKNQSEIEDKSLFNDLASAERDNMGSSKEATEPVSAAADIKSVPCGITDTSGDTGTCIKDNTGLSDEEGKLEPKSRHPISDNPMREGNEGITSQAKRKGSLVNDCKTAMKDGDGTAKVKRENRTNMILGFTEDASVSSSILEDKILSGEDSRKVMDFVEIFNQEAVQKNCGTVESRARRPKVKYEVKGRVENHASARIAAADLDDNGNYGAASSTPVVTGQSLKKEQQKTSVEGLGVKKVDGFLPEINGTSASLSDSLDASFCNMEEAHFENSEECPVEELSQGKNEVTETGFYQGKIEIKMSDTRIQEWSKGKEGNIRSLLTTLQYVLWPGSGWKPVPLVDIIEGASVRRAYQKALLCLHPDKLQQKGAETHQKYVAEKVFDILQEAWNRFNSLGPL